MIDIMSYIKYIYCVLNFIMKLYQKEELYQFKQFMENTCENRESVCVCVKGK